MARYFGIYWIVPQGAYEQGGEALNHVRTLVYGAIIFDVL
jgi:hypothetical protein